MRAVAPRGAAGGASAARGALEGTSLARAQEARRALQAAAKAQQDLTAAADASAVDVGIRAAALGEDAERAAQGVAGAEIEVRVARRRARGRGAPRTRERAQAAAAAAVTATTAERLRSAVQGAKDADALMRAAKATSEDIEHDIAALNEHCDRLEAHAKTLARRKREAQQ